MVALDIIRVRSGPLKLRESAMDSPYSDDKGLVDNDERPRSSQWS